MNLEQLRARCDRAFNGAPPDKVLFTVKAIVGSESAMSAYKEGELAVEAYRRLKDGEKPTPKQLSALQFLLRCTRPAPLVHKGKPDGLPTATHAATFTNWPAFQTSPLPLPAIGRIDRASATLSTAESVATGLFIPPDRLLTNKHVVDLLSRGTDILEEGQAVVRFNFEDGSFDTDLPVPIVAVAALHPALDLALLRLKSGVGPTNAAPPEFDTAPLPENSDIVVLGYPLSDPDRNPMFIRQIYGTQFGVLRAAPGQLTSSFDHGYYHDCSTLGGNSGSPVFSMSRRVVGVHDGGGFLWKNSAISGAAALEFVQKN